MALFHGLGNSPILKKLRLRHSLSAFVLLFGLAFAGTPAMALTVQDVRIGLHPDKTRLVFELDEMSRFRVVVLDNPWRLVVDLPAFEWQAGKISNPKTSSIATIRQGALEPGFSRIVVDLKEPVSVNDAFLLRKSADKPDRLVIDIARSTPAAWQKEKDKSFGLLETSGKTVAAAIPPPVRAQQQAPRAPEPETRQETAAGDAAPPAAPIPPFPPEKAGIQQAAVSTMAVPDRKPRQQPQAAPSRPAPDHEDGKPLIVIDPGHGGIDPGAIGANGIFEKHIALSMGKELKRMLESTGRYEVMLTRDSDTYLRLYQRVDFTRANNADLFISLHADSIGKGEVRGASIYTLSEKASDDQTEKLAERENKADIIAGTDLSHEDEQVANILIDIAMRDTMNQSKFFANTVADSLDDHKIKILESPHRYAGFAVLKAPDVPSVLVELGFMSNKNEAQMLASPDYRQKIAQALVAGIDAYFETVRRNNRT